MDTKALSHKQIPPLSTNLPLIIVCIILFVAGLLLVVIFPNQTDLSNSVPPQNEWNDFHSTAGQFKVQFPADPREIQGSSEIPSTQYRSTTSDGTEYSVSFADAPPALDVSDSRTNLENSVKAAAALVGGKVLAVNFITFKGYPAGDSTIKTWTGYLKYRSILVDRRMYSLAVASRDNHFPDLEQFFNSFETLQPSK